MRSWKKLCGVLGGVAGLMGMLATQASAHAPNDAASTALASSGAFIQAPEPFLVIVLLAGLAVSLIGLRTMKPAAIRQRIQIRGRSAR